MSLPEVSAARCPLCGQSNRCAMERAAATGQPPGPCWCTQVQFGPDLLARVPPEARNRACICEACARAQAVPGEA